jgi:protein-disulfide isomerase
VTEEPAAQPSKRATPASLIVLFVSVAAIGVAAMVWWQSRQEIASLRESQRALGAELATLRPVIDLAGAPHLGPADARVALVEFSDYECPYCRRHFLETMPKIEENYIKTGRIRYAFRDWPVDELHPQAIRAHEAAHCAGEQDKYWQMHRRLFSPAGSHTADRMADLGRELGLDMNAFARCVGEGRVTEVIRRTAQRAIELRANGTPAFFIGLRDPATDRVSVTRGITGAQPYEVFVRALEEALGKAK